MEKAIINTLGQIIEIALSIDGKHEAFAHYLNSAGAYPISDIDAYKVMEYGEKAYEVDTTFVNDDGTYNVIELPKGTKVERKIRSFWSAFK